METARRSIERLTNGWYRLGPVVWAALFIDSHSRLKYFAIGALVALANTAVTFVTSKLLLAGSRRAHAAAIAACSMGAAFFGWTAVVLTYRLVDHPMSLILSEGAKLVFAASCTWQSVRSLRVLVGWPVRTFLLTR